MTTVFKLGLAAACACLLASASFAADKKEVCAAGVGKKVCCATYTADHCGYVSCCEKGNKGFFTTSSCHECAAHHKVAAAPAAPGKGAHCASGACSKAGNFAFYSVTKAHACAATSAMGCGDHGACCSAAKTAKGGACCAAEKAKK